MRTLLPLRAAGLALAAAIAGVVVPATCASPHAASGATLPPAAAAAVAAPRDASDGGAPAPDRRPLEVRFTGSDDGYLDACGCDDGLLGGLPRRATLLATLQAGNEETLILSNGRLVAGAQPLDRRKFDVFTFAMADMGYDALAVTEKELAIGRESLAGMNAFIGDGDGLLGTNLLDRAPAGEPALPVVKALVRDVRGRKIAVFSAVATSRAALYRAADPQVEVVDPARALHEQLALVPDAARRVVLAQMTLAEAGELARALPELDLIIVQGPEHDDAPAAQPLEVGSTHIVTTGRKGKFLGSHRFASGSELAETRHEPIVDTLTKRDTMVTLITGLYRERLASEPLLASYLEQREPPGGARYAGAEEGSCASCHPKAWEIWAASKHARAWQTLVDQDLPPQSDDKKARLIHAVLDPDCVRCHVTGFGEVSGFAGVEREREDARLIDVGCEACHGPAGDHAMRASEGDPSWPGGPVPKVATGAAHDLCVRCHDPDNSPHFELKAYWDGMIRGEQRPSIAHGREGD